MSDPSKICLEDSVTIEWTIDLSALEADVLISEGAGNAITVGAAGLLVDCSRRELFRAGQTSSVAITTGAQNFGGALSVTFVDPPGMVGLTPRTSGLYHVTAMASWQSAAGGTFRALQLAITGGTQFPDVIYTGGGVSSFGSNQWLNCFDGVIPLQAGQSLGLLGQQDSGGSVNWLGNNERSGIEIMANLLMEV